MSDDRPLKFIGVPVPCTVHTVIASIQFIAVETNAPGAWRLSCGCVVHTTWELCVVRYATCFTTWWGRRDATETSPSYARPFVTTNNDGSGARMHIPHDWVSEPNWELT